MADSAYWIFTQQGNKLTGEFLIDEDVLRKTGMIYYLFLLSLALFTKIMLGVTNFDKYACVPGNPLVLDFFLEEEPSPAFSAKL